MSDVWERYFNTGSLFDPANPDHHPDADPDGDGWTNLQESIAGTNPFSANSPHGMVTVHVAYIKGSHDAQTPDQAVVTWDTLPGKQYTLKVSPDLTAASCTPVGTPIDGTGQPEGHTIMLTDTEGVTPQRLFWRVHVDDTNIDSDGDGLTDYEEFLLGSNPYAADTSGDGVPDGWLAAHGLNPTHDHTNILFPGSDVSIPAAYTIGVQAHPNANPDDLDGDGVPNDLDADPDDSQIRWHRAKVGGYAFIDLGWPSGVGSHLAAIKDFNDLSHVLLDGAVWRNGDWQPLPQSQHQGAFTLTLENEDETSSTYTYNYICPMGAGHRLMPNGDVLGYGDFTATGGPGDIMGILQTSLMPYDEANNSFGQTLTTLDSMTWLVGTRFYEYRPMAGDANGRIFLTRNWTAFVNEQPVQMTDLVEADLNLQHVTTKSFPSDAYLDWSSARMTPGGWLAANVIGPQGMPPRSILWHPNGSPVETTSSHLPYYFSDISEIQDTDVALSYRYHGPGGQIYLYDAEAEKFRYSETLSGNQIHSFAGNGTAITTDHHLWINGELVPIADVSYGYQEMLDDGWTLIPFGGNQHGTFLIGGERNGETKVLKLVPASFVPDWNRDGKIDADDYGKVSTDNPWRFWINDDDDSGDTGGNDRPQGQSASNTNSKNHKVDGLRDLVDFFPLFLDIRTLLEVLPPSHYRYRLTHPYPMNGPALKVVFAQNLKPESAGDYLRNLATANQYKGVETNAIHSAGPNIQSGLGLPGMLDALAQGEGLLLIEGVRHTTDPIILKVERISNGEVVSEIPFHVSIEGVESMFRHKNLRPYATSYVPLVPSGIDRMDTPNNLPDELCNDDWLVFLHGYNVNELQARGWHAQTFKRLFWSGSKARFLGVSWYGDKTQTIYGVTPKYHKNVINALETAGYLAPFVNELGEGSKYLVTHSLGGLVASYALANEGMDAEMAFMFDPAIPTEALLPKDFVSNDPYIEPAAWRQYPEEIKASEWHGLFTTTDARSALTWRGLVHAASPKLKIFYSEGEEVLAALPLNVPADPGLAANAPYGQYAFSIQAMLKGEFGNEPYASQESFGGTLGSLLTKAFGSLSPATEHGGWRWTPGLESPFYGFLNSEGGITKTFPFDILDTPESMARLKTDPVFGVTTPPGCAGLFHETNGHDVANEPVKFRRILADMIPERSLPAGGAGGSGVEGGVLSLQEKFADAGTGEIKVFDMQANRNGWPQDRTDMRWLHSDIREVAYTFTWPAWQRIVDAAELDREP